MQERASCRQSGKKAGNISFHPDILLGITTENGAGNVFGLTYLDPVLLRIFLCPSVMIKSTMPRSPPHYATLLEMLGRYPFTFRRFSLLTQLNSKGNGMVGLPSFPVLILRQPPKPGNGVAASWQLSSIRQRYQHSSRKWSSRSISKITCIQHTMIRKQFLTSGIF